MKTDLNTLKKELSKLTDINYLKKELNRVAKEIRRFEMHLNLNPQAKERLKALEERFQNVMKALVDLQKQVDAKVERIVKLVRKKTSPSKKATAKKATRKTTKKATTVKKATKTTRKKTSKKS